VPAPTIDELAIADDPAPWQALGFDVEGDALTLAGVLVRLAGGQAGQGIVGWSLRGISSAELDGLPTTASGNAAHPPALAHPNGIVGIDHVVAFTPQLDRTVSALQQAGMDLRRVREEPTPAGAPRQAFFRLGREILEVVQAPEKIVRETGCDQPARFWGLALLADDLDETLRYFMPHVSAIGDAVQPGRRIATVRRSAGLAVPVALLSRVEGRDSS
jgi:hypothetical protein